MEVDMDTSPSDFDADDLSIRERFRRYGRRYSASNKVPHAENSVSRFSETRTNSALFLENIKQEIEYFDGDHIVGTPTKMLSSSKRRSSVDSQGVLEGDIGADSVRRARSYALKACKHEDDAVVDGGDTTFTLFASLLDSAIQGLMPISDLILKFESSCREVSTSIRSTGEFQVVTRRRQTSGGNRQVVRLNVGYCSCGKTTVYKYPCSHIFAVTTNQGLDGFKFVTKEYSMESFIRTWESSFHPMEHEDYWPQNNLPVLLPNDFTRRVIRPGRPQTARIHSEMDVPRARVPKQCSICRVTGHDRRRCPARPRVVADSNIQM